MEIFKYSNPRYFVVNKMSVVEFSAEFRVYPVMGGGFSIGQPHKVGSGCYVRCARFLPKLLQYGIDQVLTPECVDFDGTVHHSIQLVDGVAMSSINGQLVPFASFDDFKEAIGKALSRIVAPENFGIDDYNFPLLKQMKPWILTFPVAF